MRYFKEMVKTARQFGFSGLNGTPVPKEVEEIFWSAVAQTEVFVFERTNAERKDSAGKKGEIDAPFAVFSVEIKDTPITMGRAEIGGDVCTDCILYIENGSTFAPNGLLFVSVRFEADQLKALLTGQQLKSFTKIMVVTLNGTSASDSYSYILEELLARLSVEKDGVEETNEIVMVRAGKDGTKKRPHVIKRVFHVCPKAMMKGYTSSTKRVIEWTHSWSVRGTWVYHKAEGFVGKDRQGNRNQQGRTWRVAHTKGAEDAPFISKVRVVGREPEQQPNIG